MARADIRNDFEQDHDRDIEISAPICSSAEQNNRNILSFSPSEWIYSTVKRVWSSVA